MKVRIRALWFYYDSIADIADPVEKVSMIVKYLLQSLSYEVTGYFYHFTDDIKAPFLDLCLKSVALLCIGVHDY